MSIPEHHVDPAASSPALSESGIDLFALAVTILTEWRLGLRTALVVLLLSVAFIFTLRPRFVAKASFVPQESRAESNSLAALFSTHGPGALYIGLLQSRSVQDLVIERAHLMPLYKTNSVESARDILTGQSTFTEGADTLITISVKDTNAQDAARIANAYLDALQTLNDTMGLQQSSQTTQFFERQLQQEREQLVVAEQQLAETQKQTGIVAPESQTQIGLTTIASTRAQITSLQVQLSAMLQGATEQNPDVQRLRTQIAQLQAQERMEEGNGHTPVGAAVPAGEMPKNNLDIVRAQREVRYHDLLVNSLASQFETARLNEAFSRSAFQVVDRGVAPEHKAWPPRKPFLLIAIVFSGLMGLAAIVWRLLWRRIRRDPEHQAQLLTLRQAFRLR